MIIACPACATRYVVPDSAIGLDGRTVRCAKCKHSWFQHGPELAEPIAAAYAAPPPTQTSPSRREPPKPEHGAVRSPPAEQPRVDQRSAQADDDVDEPSASAAASSSPEIPAEQPAAEPSSTVTEPSAEEEIPTVTRAAEQPLPQAEAEEDDGYSQFDHRPPFRPRRNWLRWLTWGAGAFAALALAAVVAMQTLGLPSWLPIEQPLFGADPGLEVEFPQSEQERRTLPNGAEFFGARVVVRNESRETKTVPPLLIVLRDGRERVVYSWELVPPQSSLAPGEAMTINEAMVDVPKSAVYAEIGWAPR